MFTNTLWHLLVRQSKFPCEAVKVSNTDAYIVMMDRLAVASVLFTIVIKIILPAIIAKHMHSPCANPTINKATKQALIGMMVIAGGKFLVAMQLLLDCVEFIRRYHAGVHSFRQPDLFALSGFAIRGTAIFRFSVIDSIRIPPIVAIGQMLNDRHAMPCFMTLLRGDAHFC